MKRIVFLAGALDEVRSFPEAARKEAGVQPHKVQQGLEPSDWKPMGTIGSGVREIRIHEDGGAFRVLYVHSSPMRLWCCTPSRRRRRRPRSETSIWRTTV